MGLRAGRRSSENQWSPTFSTQAFGLKVTASENDGSQEERYGKKDTAGNFIEDVTGIGRGYSRLLDLSRLVNH